MSTATKLPVPPEIEYPQRRPAHGGKYAPVQLDRCDQGKPRSTLRPRSQRIRRRRSAMVPRGIGRRRGVSDTGPTRQFWCCALFTPRPAGAATYQPRATPWVKRGHVLISSYLSPERARQRVSFVPRLQGLSLRGTHRPQGAALGCFVAPLRGDIRKAQPQNAPAKQPSTAPRPARRTSDRLQHRAPAPTTNH